jgi:hypothetical protein
VPYIAACIQNLDQKRERKVKFDSYSENNFYHFPFGKINDIFERDAYLKISPMNYRQEEQKICQGCC